MAFVKRKGGYILSGTVVGFLLVILVSTPIYVIGHILKGDWSSLPPFIYNSEAIVITAIVSGLGAIFGMGLYYFENR
ncbi:hypothetical protein A3B05_02865 [Candidatus Giovannonibacteria bacterium RIFCSPLOWO2_01_FULL_43_160]|uniref:Uncharacterized protein n=2 Tax=Candidatus Giovannoniibacteriota TaxID=1752738 RepID=A0A0G1L2I3_9BACT|nr:MAG: hypothetical protein UV72_C0008G0013 [Candidatus Giovannonibacteria bacterium GW2011_GWB1_43_13]KKS99059.1 MAG: hypothetical protein UV75_C0011G0008 [Candidatus Giovannonibacteria bacterium GW2011_GWA1_43_15]KKT21616.1 MAG: hypothetical protein UW05_C0007G0020 [Candidatus Giovannonibacteria bacterium GW2011_GWC2_43_8]KKT62807.1 MAG: hypothetical protein UW55_C0009G0038 [Candidatus Giovannonibacteria bacterium GW2011_GWA2_44_26]OGF59358.1 MAG: hypothetical protein A2652_01200 [Candidatus